MFRRVSARDRARDVHPEELERFGYGQEPTVRLGCGQNEFHDQRDATNQGTLGHVPVLGFQRVHLGRANHEKVMTMMTGWSSDVFLWDVRFGNRMENRFAESDR